MPRKITPTLTDAIADYQRVRAIGKASNTVAADGYVLAAFAKALGGHRQVHLISETDVESYMVRERERLNEASFNKTRSRIKVFFAYCIRKKWLTSNPMDFVDAVTVPERQWMRLSPDDLRDLPNHALNPRDKALLLLACNTGLRASEFLALRVGDVDLEQMDLNVIIKKTKGVDRMAMTSDLADGLAEWLAEYARDAGELQGEWFLFPRMKQGAGRRTPTGRFISGAPVTRVGVYIPELAMTHPVIVVQRALKDAGHFFEKGEGCHTLRRSAARAFFDWRVAQLGGHDSALRETSVFLHHKTTAITESYLGISSERLSRDRALRGQSFLGATRENVTPLRAVQA